MRQAPQSPGAPLPPGVLRRKELRRQRRSERLRQLWRILVFSALSAGMGYLLLRQGWTLRSPAQVEVLGRTVVSRDQVITAAGLRFPQSLMSLQPKQVSRDLIGALPVERVKVSRLMLPPRLRVELVDRQAVARAERRTSRGPEQGFVDGMGNWMSLRQHQGVGQQNDLPLRVVGWNDRHRPALALLLKERETLGSGLREIRFEPDGSLWLTTTQLGEVRLGPPDARLERRLEVVAHLGRTLPARIQGAPPQLIDLSDPEQPELSLRGPAKPSAAPARPPRSPAPAVPPPAAPAGAQ